MTSALAGGTAASVPSTTARRDGYRRRWARVPRELAYLALTAAIGAVAFGVTQALSGVRGDLVAVVVGAFLLALLLIAARSVGAFDLRRLAWARMPAIPRPRFGPAFRGKRFLRALADAYGSGHAWLYLLHGAVLSPLLALCTFTALTGVVGLVVGGIVVVPVAFATGNLRDLAGGAGPTAVLAVVVGVAALVLLPFVTRGLMWAHWGLARLVLARFRSEDLADEVADLGASRRAAVAAEDQALRRLERDIHDGPQQRLLRLQMDLASAERRLGTDPDAAVALIAGARELAGETLDELRALAAGFAPPLLQDRGLAAALDALVRRSALPTAADVRIDDALVPDAVARSAYFVVAELMSNAVKHAGATHLALTATTGSGVLMLAVRDDGIGGAEPVPGHGLAGLTERLAGLQGTIAVDSPRGGPTTVTATVPLPEPTA